jgi:omega-6 fatty acid desaturase (delta-12 desaturase)
MNPRPAWYRKLNEFQKSSRGKSAWQMVNSILPYAALFALMIYSVLAGWPYWITLLIAVPAAMVLVRVFIIFHDCTHASFLPTSRENRIVGFLTGILVFTPFEPWRLSHLGHHATAGNLDRRGIGDVETMTLEEYASASRWKRFLYRLYRNPLVMFPLGAVYTFVLLNRVVGVTGKPAERRSVLLTNLGIAVVAVSLSLAFGFRTWLAVQLPVIWIAGMMGIWLFYVQHQFDPSYWRREEEWDQIDAGLHGSSYYKLPRVLQWFSGNIGIHHIHHLRPKIPNYRLQQAYEATPEAQTVEPLTLWKSLAAIRYNLWSEVHNKFVSFREATRLLKLQSGT